MNKVYEVIQEIIADKVADVYYIEKTFREFGLDRIFESETSSSRKIPIDLVIKDQVTRNKHLICDQSGIDEMELNEILEKISEDEELQKILRSPREDK